MKLKITLLLFILISNQNIGQSQNQKTYASSITAEELKEKLYIYASDEFEGRETGEPGQKKAVEFIKDHYIALNIPSPFSALFQRS